MIALQHSQRFRIKRLGAQADAGNAVLGEHADFVLVERAWIRLDCKLAFGVSRQHRDDFIRIAVVE